LHANRHARPAVVGLRSRLAQARSRHRNHPRAAWWRISRRARPLCAPLAHHRPRHAWGGGVKPLPATWKPIGQLSASPAARHRTPAARTTTDGAVGNGDAKPPGHTARSAFNFGRHRWLGRVARDEKLPGAALRTAVLLWELQNAEQGFAWPSLTYIATEL